MRTKIIAILAWAVVLALPAAGAVAGEPAPEMQGKTFLEILESGLEINVILGVLAFAALFLLFSTLFATRGSLTVPRTLLRQILDDIASGDIDAAQNRAARDPSLLAQVLLPGLRYHDKPMERVHQAMEGAGRRSIGALRQRANYLANIGALSPMLGLLGTVLGLMKAFYVMGMEATEGSKTLLLGGAVGEAMGTTAVGLMVGIPAMFFHYLCLSRIGRIGDEVEIAAEDVAAALHEMK